MIVAVWRRLDYTRYIIRARILTANFAALISSGRIIPRAIRY